MNNDATTPRVIGTLREDGTGAARVEDRFDTDPNDLWDALTDPVRLARWLGEVDGDLRLHGSFRARFHASGWEGVGEVAVCDPPHRLLVRTTEVGEDRSHEMEVTLLEDGDGTVLVVEERGIPPEQLAAYGAGLQVHVEDLARVLSGRERCDAQARWRELFPAYERLTVTTGRPG